MMKEQGVFLTPTLVTYATMAAKEFSGFLPSVSVQKNREVLDKGLHALKIANDTGVDICFGADLLGPLHYAQIKNSPFGALSRHRWRFFEVPLSRLPGC